MSHEKMQPSTDELLQQLKEAYPQIAEELAELLKKQRLEGMFEVEILLKPTKKAIEDSQSERNFRKIPPLAKICILTDIGPRCIP